MFRKNNNVKPDSKEIGLLGTDTAFKGNIRFKGTLRIDGTVRGTITSVEGSGSVLVINQQAIVEGNVVSDAVLISGKVNGNVKAVERVEIFRSGSLKGDIFTNDVMIEGGAEFEGHCRMLNNADSDRSGKMAKNNQTKQGEQGKKSHKPPAKGIEEDQAGNAPA